MADIITIEHLSRDYVVGPGKKVHALKDVSISIRRGEYFGLLGPNGAGKTTLIRIITSLLAPTEGDVFLNGSRSSEYRQQIRKSIGVVFTGKRSHYGLLTANENLFFWASLYGLEKRVARPRIDSLLKEFGLSEVGDQRTETFSTGMLQRLNLARALLNEPEILILDEPTNGLDPEAARNIKAILVSLRKRNLTVIYTTHNLGDADDLCDRVCIIDHGELIAIGTPSELKRRVGKEIVELTLEASADQTKETMRADGWELTIGDHCERFRKEFVDFSYDELREIERRMPSISITNVERIHPTLEDVYIKITGKRGS